MKKEVKNIEFPGIEVSAGSETEIGRTTEAIYSDHVWWKKLRTGFWWPIDFSGAIDIGKKPPMMRFWGYQHLDCSGRANSKLRYMFIANLQEYGLDVLKPNDRNEIRQSFRNLTIRKIRDFDEKEARRARECWNDLVERTNWRDKMSEEVFLRYWKNLLTLPGHNVIGSYYDGQLVGWLVGVIYNNGNCYITRYASLTSFFKLRVNNGLVFAFLISAKQFCAKTVNFGLFIPDRPGLDKFKMNMGFKLMAFPAYTFINPVIRPFVLRLFGREIGRLTGWEPKSINGNIEG